MYILPSSGWVLVDLACFNLQNLATSPLYKVLTITNHYIYSRNTATLSKSSRRHSGATCGLLAFLHSKKKVRDIIMWLRTSTMRHVWLAYLPTQQKKKLVLLSYGFTLPYRRIQVSTSINPHLYIGIYRDSHTFLHKSLAPLYASISTIKVFNFPLGRNTLIFNLFPFPYLHFHYYLSLSTQTTLHNGLYHSFYFQP